MGKYLVTDPKVFTETQQETLRLWVHICSVIFDGMILSKMVGSILDTLWFGRFSYKKLCAVTVSSVMAMVRGVY